MLGRYAKTTSLTSWCVEDFAQVKGPASGPPALCPHGCFLCVYVRVHVCVSKDLPQARLLFAYSFLPSLALCPCGCFLCVCYFMCVGACVYAYMSMRVGVRVRGASVCVCLSYCVGLCARVASWCD